jgi:curved DNA-binding protein CbpA
MHGSRAGLDVPMKSLKTQNYYDVLGVARRATPEEIRSAYEISRHTFQENSLATYSLFSDQETQEILALIAKAFETLFDPDSRRAYDALLSQQEGEPASARPVAVAPAGNFSDGASQRGEGMRPKSDADSGRRLAIPPGAFASPASAAKPAPLYASANQPLPPLRPIVQKPAPGPGSAAPSPEPAARPSTPPPPPPKPALVTPPLVPNPAREEYLKTVTRFDGAALRKLRQIYGMSLEDLAERTKIRRAYLQCIEEEDFQFLPAPVYIKGFVTLLCDVYGLTALSVVEDYMKGYSPPKR